MFSPTPDLQPIWPDHAQHALDPSRPRHERVQRIQELQARIDQSSGTDLVSLHLSEQGHHYYLLGALDAAESCYRKAYELAEGETKDAYKIHIASVMVAKGELGEAESLYNSALLTFQQLGSSQTAATCTSCLGTVARLNGYMWRAESFFREALAAFESHGPSSNAVALYINLALVLLEQDNVEGAKEMLSEAAHVDDILGGTPYAAIIQHNLKVVRARVG